MPGLFGAFYKNPKSGMGDLMERMISTMNHGNNMRVDRYFDEKNNVFMGRISLGVFNAVQQPVVDPESDCLVLFHGELYKEKGSSFDPEYVLSQYTANQDHCAKALNGVFHFVVFDKRLKQIKLFSDKFGLHPIYYSVLPEGFLFAGEVKAILEEDVISKEPDYCSVGDFLHYGQILGDKTLFRDIHLLPPGSVLTYDLENRKISLSRYWDLRNLFVENGSYSKETATDDVVSLLIEAIKVRQANKEVLGLSLSGGLDSRAILAGLGSDAEGINTYTLGLQGCADQKLAERMASVAKTNHEFIEMDQTHLEDFETMAINIIHLSDGMYHPHESTEMLALEYFRKGRFKILLRGHGGEMAKAALAYPVMVSPEVYSLSSGEDVLTHILNIANLVIRDIDPIKLFTPRFRDLIQEVPRRSLKKSCGTASELLAPPDVCLFYYINEHIRRQVIASLEIFRTQIEMRLPYVDEAYLRGLLQLPVEKRNKGEIHFHLVKRCMPGLIRIANSNTGAPLDAGPLRLLIADKCNSLLKRLSVKGFRHYTEYQRWHRESFRENSERIIFADRTRDRNMYDIDYLRSVFEMHVSGKKQYGHLLGTIVALELWHRIFVD